MGLHAAELDALILHWVWVNLLFSPSSPTQTSPLVAPAPHACLQTVLKKVSRLAVALFRRGEANSTPLETSLPRGRRLCWLRALCGVELAWGWPRWGRGGVWNGGGSRTIFPTGAVAEVASAKEH